MDLYVEVLVILLQQGIINPLEAQWMLASRRLQCAATQTLSWIRKCLLHSEDSDRASLVDRQRRELEEMWCVFCGHPVFKLVHGSGHLRLCS